MNQSQFEPEKLQAKEKRSKSDCTFICPQCGKELEPSSVCEDCFPNWGRNDVTIEQEIILDSEIYKIEQDILELQSDQAIKNQEKNIAEDNESLHFTWQDFVHLLRVLTLFYNKNAKKIWIVSSLILLAFTAYISYQHFTPKGNLIIFTEKKNLVYSYTKKPLEKHVIEKNWNNSNSRDISPRFNYYSNVRASQDEKYIIYQKQVEDNDIEKDGDLGTYYRYDVESNKKIKVDDQVRNSFSASSTNISSDGTKAFYLKGTDNKLVFWNNGKKIKIDEMVDFYFVNKQATHVFYGKQGSNYENQGKIFEWSEKSGKKTVAENSQLHGLQMDQIGEIIIYFKEERSMYSKKGNKAIKQISDKVDNILSICGEKVYYTVSSSLPFTYRDFVVDSLVESDKEIVQPSVPLSGEYTQKLQRDMIRQSFDQNITNVVSDLYYFDGEKSFLLEKNIGVTSSYSVKLKNPLLIYRKIDENTIQNLRDTDIERQKIDISKVYDLNQIDNYITQLVNQNSKIILAQGTNKGTVEQNNGTQFMVSPNGKWIGFIDDSSYANQDPLSKYSSSYYAETGRLKKFKIEDITEFKPSLVDDNVNANFFFKGDELFYTKGSSEGNQSVDLYVDGKTLLKNVEGSTNASFEMYRYYGLTNTADLKAFYGLAKSSRFNNLYEIIGDSKRELAKNVEMFVPLKDKSILYLKDYNRYKGYGKLMVDDGKNKSVLISERATLIFQNNDFLWY